MHFLSGSLILSLGLCIYGTSHKHHIDITSGGRRMDVSPRRKFSHYINRPGTNSGFSDHNFNKPGYREFDTAKNDKYSRPGFGVDNFSRPGGGDSFFRPHFREHEDEGGDDIDGGDEFKLGIGDPAALAQHLMWTGFDLYSKGPVPVFKLIKGYLKGTSGSSRMMMLRMIEMMDDDLDQVIDRNEFGDEIATAAESPRKAAEMIFQMYDLDGADVVNGDETKVITKYEWATVLMLQAETDKSILDIWHEVSKNFHDRDFNKDGVVTMREFVLNEFYEAAAGVASEIEDNDFNTPL